VVLIVFIKQNSRTTNVPSTNKDDAIPSTSKGKNHSSDIDEEDTDIHPEIAVVDEDITPDEIDLLLNDKQTPSESTTKQLKTVS
jgi:hypothetical protein